MALLIPQVASQRTWPAVGDVDDCWILAWQMAQIAVAPWEPWLDATTARRYAGDPDDGVNDGNDRGVWDMVRGIRAATPKLAPLCGVQTGRAWEPTLADIKSGRPFAAAVMGGELPKIYTRVPHQVVIFHEPGVGLRLADPMAPDRSEPYRIATLAAAKACASFAGAGKATGVLFPTVAAAFPTHPLYTASGYSQAQLDAAVDDAVAATAAPLEARIASIKAESADSAATIAAL